MTKITYNGKTTELADGYIATLPCKDYKMETDVVIEAPEGSGGSSGGGAELNIAYGDTAPEDTSKLWVKTSKPSAVKVSSNFRYRGSDGTFETLTEALPSELCNTAGAVVDGKIYTFGGYINDNPAATIGYFDTATETATTLSVVVPTATQRMYAVAYGKKIIFGAGITKSGFPNTWYCFDTTTETLTTCPWNVSNFWNSGILLDGTNLYLLASAGTQLLRGINLETNTNISSYDMPNIAEKWHDCGCAQVGKVAYRFGGGTDRQIAGTRISYFNPLALPNLPEITATLPKALYYPSTAVLGDLIYIFGGRDANGTYSSEVYCFDTKSRTISTVSVELPIAIGWSQLAHTIGKTVYIMGGSPNDDPANRRTVQKFTADLEVLLDNGNVQIEPSLADNTFTLINTDTAQVEIGVNKVYKGNADGIAEVVEAALYNGTEWETI